MGLLAGKEEALAVRDAAVAVAPHRALRRVAMLVVHSNPVGEPGVGDGGGMPVYVRQMARALAARGLEVDVYTRRDAAATPRESKLFPGVVVRQVTAGAPELSKEEIPAYLPEFTANLACEVERRGGSSDPLPRPCPLAGEGASLPSAPRRAPLLPPLPPPRRAGQRGPG